MGSLRRFLASPRLLLAVALALFLPACSLFPFLNPAPAPAPVAPAPVPLAPAPPTPAPPEPAPPAPAPAPAPPAPVVPAPVAPAPAPVRQRQRVETPESIFARGRKLLADGQFGEAAKSFEKLIAIPDYDDSATAYVYLGIASLARINPANVAEAKMYRLKGFANFQNAFRFDPDAALPKGYEKYADVFDEARKSLP